MRFSVAALARTLLALAILLTLPKPTLQAQAQSVTLPQWVEATLKQGFEEPLFAITGGVLRLVSPGFPLGNSDPSSPQKLWRCHLTLPAPPRWPVPAWRGTRGGSGIPCP